MGYRLGIHKTDLIYYGTKLYGYVDNIEELESYKFLVNKGLIDEELFSTAIENTILIRGEDLLEFIKLYNNDINNFSTYIHYIKDYFISEEKIKELMKNIEPYEWYILNWS